MVLFQLLILWCLHFLLVLLSFSGFAEFVDSAGADPSAALAVSDVSAVGADVVAVVGCVGVEGFDGDAVLPDFSASDVDSFSSFHLLCSVLDGFSCCRECFFVGRWFFGGCLSFFGTY
ncbi:hypothetical protein Ancab_002397 [Ancistrocladus abbreviatus]